MRKAKILTVGATLLISGAALAQQRPKSDPIYNAARSGGSTYDTHDMGVRSGSVANTEKIFGNNKGYYQPVIEYSSRARR